MFHLATCISFFLLSLSVAIAHRLDLRPASDDLLNRRYVVDDAFIRLNLGRRNGLGTTLPSTLPTYDNEHKRTFGRDISGKARERSGAATADNLYRLRRRAPEQVKETSETPGSASGSPRRKKAGFQNDNYKQGMQIQEGENKFKNFRFRDDSRNDNNGDGGSSSNSNGGSNSPGSETAGKKFPFSGSSYGKTVARWMEKLQGTAKTLKTRLRLGSKMVGKSKYDTKRMKENVVRT